MASVCIGAEKMSKINRQNYHTDSIFETAEETIVMSTMFAANHVRGIKGIIALTESGRTALMMSRFSSGLPIFALSGNESALNVTLPWVFPVYFDFRSTSGLQNAQKQLNY